MLLYRIHYKNLGNAWAAAQLAQKQSGVDARLHDAREGGMGEGIVSLELYVHAAEEVPARERLLPQSVALLKLYGELWEDNQRL